MAAALAGTRASVEICARRLEAADELARRLGVGVARWPLHEAAELIVNATPVGQAGDPAELPLEETLLGRGTVVCDLAYRGDGRETALAAVARRRGARVVDGLDVLVGQGARSFRLFTGLEPPLEVMRAAARRSGLA